ncbi:hypothetical protein N657DRAFT_127740 [Parathielavia appendiculata]|uniref:Uncharacterized protein n=1 Tax=Parathielavia appendiculata TaxID=2587402 RepID=A0AAN6Z0Z5_9PEZI|nr:hypothetical protein N657DRAFT_127740 [Parathielavia appendiculata]
MFRDAKDHKHRPDALRQPQRRDSLSSILSWAALQGKITASRTSTAPSSTASPQPSPGTSTRPRRHSQSASTETKTKARRGSSTFRRLSLSTPTATHDEAGTKTRHSKTFMAADSKASPGTSKTPKNGSSEKINKTPSRTQDGMAITPARPQSAQDKPRPPGSPVTMPKSILRVSSPDSSRRPRQLVSPETGEPTSPSPSPSPLPSSAVLGTLPPDSPAGSPPMSPVQRPMSPGATVRFAKATIHRVEVIGGAGRRRLLPVKRKSKSTLTYLSPLDPGAHKSAVPKTMLQNPIKLRRHQENQAAMGRYWLRTEEEEAQWRAEAERRAAEEAERYRNEPASPPPVGGSAADGGSVGEGLGPRFASKIVAIDTLSSLDSGQALDKVVVELAESRPGSPGSDAGTKCNQGEPGPDVLKKSKEEKRGSDGAREVRVEMIMATEATEEPRLPDVRATASLLVPDGATSESPTPEQATPEMPDLKPTITAAATQQPSVQPADATTTTLSAETTLTLTPKNPKPADSRSVYGRLVEKLVEKQAAEEGANRTQSPPPLVEPPESATTKPDTDFSKPAGSSFSSLSKEGSSQSPSGRPSSASSGCTLSTGSYSYPGEQLPKISFREREKEFEKEVRRGTDRQEDRDKEKQKAGAKESERGKEKEREKPREGKARTVSPTSYRAATKEPRSEGEAGRMPKASGSTSSSRTGHSSSTTNHLHLSGRRGRRYFEEHKQGITA